MTEPAAPPTVKPRRPKDAPWGPRLLAAYAQGLGRSEAAAFAGVSPWTASRWLTRHAAEVHEARSKVSLEALEEYRSGLADAARRLKREVVDLENGAAGIAAARSLVEGFKSLNEVTFMRERLAQLDAALRAELQGRGIDVPGDHLLPLEAP